MSPSNDPLILGTDSVGISSKTAAIESAENKSAVSETAENKPAETDVHQAAVILLEGEDPAALGYSTGIEQEEMMPAVNVFANESNEHDSKLLSGVEGCGTTMITDEGGKQKPLLSSATVGQGAGTVDSLEDQLKALQLRLEILRVQEEIRSLESGGFKHMVGQPRHFDLSEIDTVIPPFNGEDHYDIMKWFNQFEEYCEMCGYGDKEKSLGLRRRLTGAARSYVFNLGSIGYQEMKAKLIKLFKRTVTQQEVYRQLQTRKLLPSETSLNYVIAMQTIASQASVDEQELVDLIIDGIPDSGSHVTFLYGANSMDELIRRLDRFEQRRRHAVVEVKKVATVGKAVNKTTAAVQPNTAKTSGELVRCYNCSQFGHYQSMCPKPIRPQNSCFHCGVVGHYRQHCPKRVRGVAAVTEEGGSDVDPVDAFQTVSIAFFIRDKCTKLRSSISLFDSGSPVSCIKKSMVPVDINNNENNCDLGLEGNTDECTDYGG